MRRAAFHLILFASLLLTVSARAGFAHAEPAHRLSSDTYDANGNTLLAPGFGLLSPDQFDFEDRLTRRQAVGATVQLFYDGDGQRVAKTVTTPAGAVTTYYLVDELNPTGYGQVLEELTLNPQLPHLSTPQVTRTYTWGHALLTQDRLNGPGWSASFYGLDGHNNVRYLTDLAGNVTDTYDYDAFGNLISQSAISQSPTPNFYLFTGEQFDADLGLYYLRARYHNPQTGRFWSMDTFEGYGSDPQSLHKYAYCANNPVNCYDPSGNVSLPELSVATGLRATVGTLLSGVLGGTFGAIAGGYEALGQGKVTDAEVAEGMREGFVQGAKAGLMGGAVGGVAGLAGRVGRFAVTGVGVVYTGLGFVSTYAALLEGNYDEAGLYAAGTILGAATSVGGFASGGGHAASPYTTRGFTTALTRYYTRDLLRPQIIAAKTTVYRVEGLPNTRVLLGEGGQVSVQGDQMLFLSFGDKARAEQFLATRLQQGMPGAQMKSFEVPQSFLNDLRASAVPESMVKQFPGRPLLVDPTKAADQFGLRPDQIEALRQAIIQGSWRAH